MNTRTCKKCGETTTLDSTNFGSNPSGVGFRHTCRRCVSRKSAEYYAAHPDNAKARSEKRRERKLRAGPDYTDSDVQKLRLRLGGRCRYCSCALDGTEEVDHLTPISCGGTNAIGNLTLACLPCNREKHAKTLAEYINWRAKRGRPIRKDTPPGESPDVVTYDELRAS